MLPLCYRLSMQNPQRAISALSLLITCMYTGREGKKVGFSWHSAFLEDFDILCSYRQNWRSTEWNLPSA